MPQEIRVLCCFKCKTYQVDIVKKAKKWQCKMCQEKQSVFKEYFRGTGAECRLKVQELNSNVHNQKAEVENEFLSFLDNGDLDIDMDSIVSKDSKQSRTGQLKMEGSKWLKYVDEIQPPDQHADFSEPLAKLKRKSFSSFSGDEVFIAKNPRQLAPGNSKWDKYL